LRIDRTRLRGDAFISDDGTSPVEQFTFATASTTGEDSSSLFAREAVLTGVDVISEEQFDGGGAAAPADLAARAARIAAADLATGRRPFVQRSRAVSP